MAEVVKEKEVMGMKIDLLPLLSVDPGDVKSDGCSTFWAPKGPLYLIFIIDEAAQTSVFLCF